jgi:hypothetical protein
MVLKEVGMSASHCGKYKHPPRSFVLLSNLRVSVRALRAGFLVALNCSRRLQQWATNEGG